ncbi:hypothetical protein L0666_06525 [Octadecabacter sp. CECT 8868]|uniref:hypothetical protein n=1 Tax=Octadecabacter algicola TaxID=2909342 RepID=UPI001F42CF71|nr:hypothetical protein [Octadecabacter algicola]MCF2904634.1 hypothetical protein [Octadecabacter algicola]
MIEVFSTDRDNVINSIVAIGKANYSFALDELYPLLNRFGEQRKLQSKGFYSRLKSDILSGCIMPPITLAFVSQDSTKDLSTSQAQKFINENIKEGYILDGMQRLNTLHDASEDLSFDVNRPIHINVIIAKKYDLLLYRMITLNNGQKPMTARHQIEMLTGGAIDISGVNFPILTEKETENIKVSGAFKKSDIIEAYTAYLTNNVNNQNKKIIESKLNDILVGRVMESSLTDEDVSFSAILEEVGRLSTQAEVRTWLRLGNNLIGFTVGAKQSLAALRNIEPDDFAQVIAKFDQAFDAINPSKVNVGKIRRELSYFFVSSIDTYAEASVGEIEAAFFEQTISE